MSLRRKESSTAFFSHWWTGQPSGPFSATRSSPRSRPSSAASTASRISPAVCGPTWSRASKAASITPRRAAWSIPSVSAARHGRAPARPAGGIRPGAAASTRPAGRPGCLSLETAGQTRLCRAGDTGAARYLSRWPRTRVHSRRTGAHRQVVVVVTRLGGFPHDLLAVAVCVADLCRALCCRSAPARLIRSSATTAGHSKRSKWRAVAAASTRRRGNGPGRERGDVDADLLGPGRRPRGPGERPRG